MAVINPAYAVKNIRVRFSRDPLREKGKYGVLDEYYLEDDTTLEQEYQQRCEAAYKDGVEDGRKLGVQQGREDIQPALRSLVGAVEEMSRFQESLKQDRHRIISQLSVSIAEGIIHKQIETDDDLITTIVTDILKLVDDRRRISLKVHPVDWQVLKEHEEKIREVIHGIQELEIKESREVSRGGCVIESDSGILDGRLETRINEIKKRLLGEY